MHDLQYNGGKQLHTATGLIAACTHKSALSLTCPPVQCISVQEIYLDISHWMQLFVVMTTCFWRKCKEKLKHALTCSMWQATACGNMLYAMMGNMPKPACKRKRIKNYITYTNY